LHCGAVVTPLTTYSGLFKTVADRRIREVVLLFKTVADWHICNKVIQVFKSVADWHICEVVQVVSWHQVLAEVREEALHCGSLLGWCNDPAQDREHETTPHSPAK